jgi:hypothetical protein
LRFLGRMSAFDPKRTLVAIFAMTTLDRRRG